MHLARYAELVVARQAPGANRRDVLARFSLDEAAHERVETHWRGRFAASGLLGIEFQRHLAAAGTAKSKGPSPALPPASSAAASRPASPTSRSGSASPSAGAPREMTVDQYAFVAATLRRAPPAEVPAILARFRLDPTSRSLLDRSWAERMAAEPGLRQAFMAAFARHCGSSP